MAPSEYERQVMWEFIHAESLDEARSVMEANPVLRHPGVSGSSDLGGVEGGE